MHDTIIAQEIIDKAKRQGIVKSVLIEVGELADVTADELTETLKAMVNWSIVTIEKKAIVRCSCGYKGAPKIIEKRHALTFFVCPVCSSLPRVLEGKDIFLKEVEVEH